MSRILSTCSWSSASTKEASEWSMMYDTSLSVESWYSPRGTAPAACAATSPHTHSGRLSPMIATLSPAFSPRETMPREKYLTCSWYSFQLNSCQMPNSFSRIAILRSPNTSALRTRSFGNVSWVLRISFIRSARLHFPQEVVVLSDVRLDDARVVGDLRRLPFRDLHAEIEDAHPVADVHHDAEVVLDQQNRDAPLLVDVDDEAGHVLLLFEVHPGHRLVEEQELRLERQRPAELDPLAKAVGQRPHRLLPDVFDLEEVDDVLYRLPVLDLLVPGRPEEDAARQDPALHELVAAQHQVVEDGHVVEEGDVLEGAGDPQVGHLVRVHPGDLAVLEVDRAALRLVDARDAVEDRRFPGAVGADDRVHAPLRHVDRDPVDRLHPPEGEVDVVDPKQRHKGSMSGYPFSSGKHRANCKPMFG